MCFFFSLMPATICVTIGYFVSQIAKTQPNIFISSSVFDAANSTK